MKLALAVLVGWLVACGGSGGLGPPCPPGTRFSHVCTKCGPAGGCAAFADECAQTCTQDSDCGDGGVPVGCFAGVCQTGLCI